MGTHVINIQQYFRYCVSCSVDILHDGQPFKIYSLFKYKLRCKTSTKKMKDMSILVNFFILALILFTFYSIHRCRRKCQLFSIYKFDPWSKHTVTGCIPVHTVKKIPDEYPALAGLPRSLQFELDFYPTDNQ